MANLAYGLQHVKSHLDQMISSQEILHLAEELGLTWRKRKLNPATTVCAWLLQLLAHVALAGLGRVTQIPASAAAFCKAKQRLPLQLLQKLVARSSRTQGAEPWRWKTFTLCLVDGTSATTPDTAPLAGHFGKAKNQRGTSSGYPIVKLLALLDGSTGLLSKVISLPSWRQEPTCLTRLWAVAAGLGEKVLVLGDRGLVSFSPMALLLSQGLQGCFRLPKCQVVKSQRRKSGRLLKRLGRQDLLVSWSRTTCPKWMSRPQWEAPGPVDCTLILRQIAFRVYRPGYRVTWAWIITTLLDPTHYPAQELIELYGRRWQVEVYFRDLKQTLKMKALTCRTLAGVQKEILLFVLLYNLVRRVMLQAAVHQGTTPNRLSFIDACRWLLWSSPGTPLPALKINALRIRPAPPRRLKSTRTKYPPLHGHRPQLTRPPCSVKL